jgi:PPOX class probable F420-dependent enzyme
MTLLDDAAWRFLRASRRAVLATTGPAGRVRLVPICFALEADAPPRLLTPIDEKPKRSGDPLALARVRDVLAVPGVTVLVDRWDEDWNRLAWLRLYGVAELLEPEPRHARERSEAITALRAKYPQYAAHALESRPIIRIAVTAAVAWGDLT